LSGFAEYRLLMGLSTGLGRLWRWLQPSEQSLEEIAEEEKARSRAREHREKAIDQFYEEGFPSRDAALGPTWPL
jgi:hypothetical protein